MKLKIKSIPAKLMQIANKVRPFLAFGFILAGLLVYGLLALQITRLNNAEPTAEQIDERLGTVKKSKIDQASVDKIEQLNDQNVQVQSLFKQARENPFSE